MLNGGCRGGFRRSCCLFSSGGLRLVLFLLYLFLLRWLYFLLKLFLGGLMAMVLHLRLLLLLLDFGQRSHGVGLGPAE